MPVIERKFVEAIDFYSFEGFSSLAGDISETSGGATDANLDDIDTTSVVNPDVGTLYWGDDGSFRFSLQWGATNQTGNTIWDMLSVKTIVNGTPRVAFRTDATNLTSPSTNPTQDIWEWAANYFPTNPMTKGTGNWNEILWTSLIPGRLSTTTTNGFMFAVCEVNGEPQGSTFTNSGGSFSHTFDISSFVEPGDKVAIFFYYCGETTGTSGATNNFCASNETTTITRTGTTSYAGGFSAMGANTTNCTATNITSGTPNGTFGFFGTGDICQYGYHFTATSTHDYVDFRYRDNTNTSIIKDFSIVMSTAVNPPAISSVTDDDAFSSAVTAFVNLSSPGNGGTALEYAQTTGTGVPSTGWQTSNQFSQPRNSTRYYWASRDRNTAGSFSSNFPKTVNFISVDSNINNIQDRTISNTAANFGVSIVNGTEPTTYEIRTTSYSGTIVGSGQGSGTITVNDVPADNSSKTYYVTAYVDTTDGGANNTRVNIQTFLVTASNAAPSYGIEVFNSSANLVFSPEQESNIRILASGTTGSLSPNGTFVISEPGCGNQNVSSTYLTVPESDDVDVLSITYNSTNDTVTIQNLDSISHTYGYVCFRYK